MLICLILANYIGEINVITFIQTLYAIGKISRVEKNESN
jgi:hypothetical protein